MSNEIMEPGAAQDCVEPELLHNGRPGADENRGRPREGIRPPGLLTRLKTLLAAGLALLALGLFSAGALLTSTVIGAIIGIPLMLAGALAFFLLFKLLSSGSGNFAVFRRF